MTPALAHSIPVYDPVSYSAHSYVETVERLKQQAEDGFIVPGYINETVTPSVAHFISHALGKCERALDVPLCSGCDRPIAAHCCDFCELIFYGTPPNADGIEL